MSERRAQYITQPYEYQSDNGNGVPPALLRLAYRLAQLERGNMYTITVTIPHDRRQDPQWSVLALGKIENAR